MDRSLSSRIRGGEPTDAVSCRELTKRFGDTVAVDSLDLSVAPGETFGFLGPNGAGKTTTLRILLGLIRPTSGVARLDTGATSGLSSVGAMVEEPAFYPWLSGRAPSRLCRNRRRPVRPVRRPGLIASTCRFPRASFVAMVKAASGAAGAEEVEA